MADNETPTPSEQPAKPAARRRSTTPAKAAASKARPTKASAETSAPAKATKAKAKPAPKPRSTKRAAPKTTTRKVADAASRATSKIGGGWGAAAIAGGLAAAGAAAALLTLRGSSAKPTDPAKPTGTGEKAHQPDGTDSSKSFNAGIADENTVPE